MLFHTARWIEASEMMFRLFAYLCLLCAPSLCGAIARSTPPLSQAPHKPRLTHRTVYRLPNADAWAVSPSGDVIALVTATADRVSVQTVSLASRRPVAQASLVNREEFVLPRLRWVASGRSLILGGAKNSTVLEFDPARHALSKTPRPADKEPEAYSQTKNRGLYDLSTGPARFGRHDFTLRVEQPVAPKGKYGIMVVQQARVFAVSLDGKRRVPLLWRSSERIDGIQCAANGRVFVRLYRDNSSEKLILHEYRLLL